MLLITLDTARADRFSYTGSSPVPTPNVDGLAAEGTAFLQAVSPAPITLVAHASLMTGLTPPVHGIRNNGTYRLTNDANTMAEAFGSGGYSTAAFVGAAVLDASYGLDQGFELYDDSMTGKPGEEFEPQRRGAAVVESALRWIDRNRDSPTFVWVHLFDPHVPYDSPEPEKTRYANAPYDGEIAYSDRMIGRLLDEYRRFGLYDRTIVVFTSDHGEALGEHGELTHGIFLFDATVRVPLILRVPGRFTGVRVQSQVSLIDVMPTLTTLLDLAPRHNMQGRSLLPLMHGESIVTPPAYLETRLPLENHDWFELRGLRTESMKLVSGPTTELYDLAADPEESRNLAGTRVDDVSSLLRVLDEEFGDRDTGLSDTVELSDVTRQQLTALGYISSGGPSSPPAPGATRYTLKRARLTLELLERGFKDLAYRRCREMAAHVSSSDCINRLRELLGTKRSGARESLNPPPSTRVLAEEIRAERGVPTWSTAATLLHETELGVHRGDLESVRRKLSLLTRLLLESNGGPKGRAGAPSEIDSRELLTTAAALSQIGTACFERLAYENAVHAYLIGSHLVPDDPSFHYNLGLAWERLGDVDEALLAFEKTVDLDPGFGRAGRHRRYVEAVRRRLGSGIEG